MTDRTLLAYADRARDCNYADTVDRALATGWQIILDGGEPFRPGGDADLDTLHAVAVCSPERIVFRQDFRRTLPGASFTVVCTEDGHGYVLATRQTFATREDAEEYAATCAPSRTPLVVEGRWAQLRGPGAAPMPSPSEAAAWENAESNAYLNDRYDS